MSQCKNCQQHVNTNFKYCPACGQSATSFQRPFSKVAMEMLHELLDIDGRLWLTVRTLLLKPGVLTKEYNQGMRIKYSPPLRMYLVISIIFFVVFANFRIDTLAEHQGMTSIHEHYPKIMFVLLPVYAFIVKIFYWRTYYIANLIFAIHIHCIAYLVLMITSPIEYFEENHISLVILQGILLTYFLIYVLLAFKTNYQQNWFQTVWKFIASLLIYLMTLGLVFDAALHQLNLK